MSRRNGRGSEADSNEFPFFDEPEGRRRRAKKRHETYRKSNDEVGRPRRPLYEDDEPDWDDDSDDADWQASEDDGELDLAGDLDDGGEWDEGAGGDREDDESGEEDGWRSRDDR